MRPKWHLCKGMPIIFTFGGGKCQIITARVRRMGKVLFSQVSRSTGAGGIPHLHPIILPLVPGPLPGRVPSHERMGILPPLPSGTGQDGIPPPSSETGQDGIPPPSSGTGQDGVPPPPPPWDMLCFDRLCGLGGTPLVVSRRRQGCR